MSTWTHVNASIRFGWPGLPDLSRNLPEGSEGPLHIHIWINPNTSSAAMYTVNIFGDLRDYKEGESIVEYFTEICKDRSIRSGILEIDVANSMNSEAKVYQFKYAEDYRSGSWILKT